MKKKIVGTGKFIYDDVCTSCGKKGKLNITGECRQCYDWLNKESGLR